MAACGRELVPGDTAAQCARGKQDRTAFDQGPAAGCRAATERFDQPRSGGASGWQQPGEAAHSAVLGPATRDPSCEWVRRDRCHRYADRAAGAVDELADAGLAQTEIGGELLARPSHERGFDQGRPLALREGGDLGEQVAGELALVKRCAEPPRVYELIRERLGGLAIAGDLVKGGVTSDSVQPARDVLDLSSRAQRGPGAKQRLLDGVLGALDPRYSSGGADQRGPVAFDQYRERQRLAVGSKAA